MKTARFAATAIALLFVVGCGGVGGIPVDVGGVNFNGDLNIGDINLGEGGFGDELLDTLAESVTDDDVSETEAETDEAETDEAETEIVAEPHPADTDMDFFIDSDELLAYGVAFQNDELDEGQNENWLDVAVSIWQTRSDGAYFDDMESIEPSNWQPVDDAQADQPETHPADTDGDFLLTSEEVLAYASSFQNDELDEGQDESWLDVAVSIWQARTDGAYYDDMESPQPLNWISMDESGVVTEIESDVVTEIDGVVDVVDDTADTTGEGYDILFQITPLSPVSFDLTVVDPTEKYNSDYGSPAELGWTEGTAWDGFYRVQVYAGNNYNNVNEQMRFSISVYKGGELILEEEHAIAESSLWDDLSIAYP